MVAMRVRDEDVGDLLLAQRIEQRADVRGIVRSWVDDRDFAIADDVRAGTGKGERAWIRRHDAPHLRRDPVDAARGDIKITVKWDVVGHGENRPQLPFRLRCNLYQRG